MTNEFENIGVARCSACGHAALRRERVV